MSRRTCEAADPGLSVLAPGLREAVLPVDPQQSLDQWFEEQGISRRVRREFADSGMLRAFGARGEAIFAAPTAVQSEVRRMYGVDLVGRDTSVCVRFYAVSVDRRIKHPAVAAITAQASKTLAR